MKKVKKLPFIITFCVAFAFLAATAALLFIPEPKPLKITEKPTVEYVDGEYVVHGKIKNVSENEIILREYGFCAEVSAINEIGDKVTYEIKPYNDIAVQPDEEIDLSFLHAKLGSLQSVKINKIVFTPEQTGITIYGNVINNGNFAIYALFTGIAGAGLLLIAVVSLVTGLRNTKRANNIISQMRQTFQNGVYVEGYYGNKAQNRTAAAKTTASVFGAIVSMLFIGFGRYKVYSNSAKSEYIITETSIYMYSNGKFRNVTNELKSAFVNPAVTDKNNKINVNGEDKNVYFTVRANGADKAQTISNLKNIFENTAQPDNTQGQNYGETD